MSYKCAVCDDTLLRHLRKSGLSWFCRSCRQDMPNPQNGDRQPLRLFTVQPKPRPLLSSYEIADRKAGDRPAKPLAPKPLTKA